MNYSQTIRYLARIVWPGIFFIAFLSSLQSSQAQVPKLKWGAFATHPAKAQIEKQALLSELDSKMLSLCLQKAKFDPVRFSRLEGFSAYFAPYNKAKDEFERNRVVGEIQRKFERRQTELLNIDFFVTRISGRLGEYSFEDKAFPFTPDKENPSIAILNAEWRRTILDRGMEREQTVFPSLIRFSEKEAERISKSIPSRELDLILLVKPMGPLVEFYSSFYGIPLYGIAIFNVVVIPKGNEVIAVFPSAETYNYELLRSLKSYLDAISTISSISQYESNVEGVSEYEYQAADRVAVLKKNIDKYKDEMKKQKWTLAASIDTLELAISARISNQHQMIESLLSSCSTYPGKLKSGIWSPDAISLRFLSFDPSTLQFTAELESGKSIRKIDGKVVEDLLGPKITFDETAFITKDRGVLRRSFSLRLKSGKALIGSYSEGKVRIEVGR